MATPTEHGALRHPVEVGHELRDLRVALAEGRWAANTAEREVAGRLVAAGGLTAAGIRAELPSEIHGEFFSAMERVATVLDLPAVHEDAETRPTLLNAASALLEAVAS
jgi:hypothetical protein